MIKNKHIRVIAIVAITLFYFSCNHYDQLTVNNSSNNTSRSHNVGKDCMSCHKKGGGGEGWFNVAGSAFQSNNAAAQNISVKLYTQANGTGNLVKEIQGDLLGNFYTTDIIPFGQGLYPVVEYNGNQHFMSGSITKGACNSCHGISTTKITVN
jgi:hypothetical protein